MAENGNPPAAAEAAGPSANGAGDSYLHDRQLYGHHDIVQSSNRGSRENPNSIESQLSRLGISSTMPPSNGGNVRSGEVEIRNQLPQLCNGDSLLTGRIQSAARGHFASHMQYRNFPDILGGGDRNLDVFPVNGNSNSIACYGFGNGSSIWGNTIGASVVPNDYFSNEFSFRNHDSPANLGHQSRVLEPSSSLFMPNMLPNFSSLEEVRGSIFLVAKHPYSRWFVERKLEEGNPLEIKMIFDELKDHIHDLMIDRSGNHVVQKLFPVCSEEQISELLFRLFLSELNFISICTHALGNQVVQRLLDNLENSTQRIALLNIMSRNVVSLTNNTNSHHVILHFMRHFPRQDIKPFVFAMEANIIAISTDQNGCCFIQKIVAVADGESRQRLMNAVTNNAMTLSEDQYGNYVVQHLLGLRIPHVTLKILVQLTGRFVSLSMNKYASNVVQKCLQTTGPHYSVHIVKELLPSLLSLVQHPYGNYVVQSALQVSKDELRQVLIRHINDHYAILHSQPYGKRVLMRLKDFKHLP